ncbi:bifunctional folylpolyglutamate synthase/dihydrofolate synthase [Flavobacteriaceae bacterium]|nr:bifunctional folylpolyglutamate synthase/dihydrofolate synthase [Flavobacteriaceae bacterium]
MRSYKETLAWMFSKLPMYQRIGEAAYRPGLDAMKGLDVRLNHPHKKFESIHVGGTNGKGSSAHMLASVFQQAGFKTGLYTSPHLLDFRERIKIDGNMIPEDEVVDFIKKHKAYFEQKKLSFFEMTVGMAFAYFEKEKVDYVIVEVGLGGRLDATNIINPILSVITNIGLDHTQFLGTTRAEIAAEKAGIIKEGVPVVIGEKDAETESVYRNRAKLKNAPIIFATEEDSDFKSDLKGNYQNMNIQTVVTALKQLRIKGITDLVIQEGLSRVSLNTNLMGRWQTLSEAPRVIVDVAHNKEGLRYIAAQLNDLTYTKLHLVMGFVKGRDVDELISLFPLNASYYLSTPNLDRGLPIQDLKDVLREKDCSFNYFESVSIAFEASKAAAFSEDLILVCGSTFVVAEVLSYIKK